MQLQPSNSAACMDEPYWCRVIALATFNYSSVALLARRSLGFASNQKVCSTAARRKKLKLRSKQNFKVICYKHVGSLVRNSDID